MPDKKTKLEVERYTSKEFQLPETVFVRDIDNSVFQGIILQCLAKIPDIALLEGNFIDNILGRTEGVKGIQTEQDPKTHSINVRIEVNIAYGISIPEKAEEIQTKISQELTKLTGLHVSQVHVVFKQLIMGDGNKKQAFEKKQSQPVPFAEEYTDIF